MRAQNKLNYDVQMRLIRSQKLTHYVRVGNSNIIVLSPFGR